MAARGGGQQRGGPAAWWVSSVVGQRVQTPTRGDHKGLHPATAPLPPLPGLRAPAGRPGRLGRGGSGRDEGRGPLWPPAVEVSSVVGQQRPPSAGGHKGPYGHAPPLKKPPCVSSLYVESSGISSTKSEMGTLRALESLWSVLYATSR